MCHTCGEKNSTNFSYCWKCGAELTLEPKSPHSSQEPSIQPSTQEKIDHPTIGNYLITNLIKKNENFNLFLIK